MVREWGQEAGSFPPHSQVWGWARLERRQEEGHWAPPTSPLSNRLYMHHTLAPESRGWGEGGASRPWVK
jgi:hypothetical protein